ncbi:MAG: HlyD family efflux transporter periplasmic adaptor subunit [Firmicutes bacterium]|nr:HlyD family efflux transporter periplasmic adaptor subunit [Bacillota bacterium]
MAEEKILHRGWVKNAAIVFLLIMLLLTFFSNTLLNRSLPEVAVQYAQSGTVNAKIRGTGTVTANQTYDVTLSQSRKIEAVAIKVGDEVAFGDVLFVLGDTESEELKQAQDALDDMNLEYRKALIDAGGSDYAKEKYAIQSAEKDLATAKAERDKNKITDEEMQQAEARVEAAKAEVDGLTRQVEDLTGELAALEGGATDSEILAAQRALEDKEKELDAARDEYDKVELVHRSAYSALKRYASGQFGGSQAYQLAAAAEKLSAVVEDLQQRLRDLSMLEEPSDADRQEMIRLANQINEDNAMIAAQSAYAAIESRIDDLELEVSRLDDDYDGLLASNNSSEYEIVKKKLKSAEIALKEAENMHTKATDYAAKLTDKQTAYREALAEVAQMQKNLDDLTMDLAEAKKNDGKTSAKEKLDLQNMQSNISKKRQELEALQKDAVGSTVTAPMAGIVKAVNVTAGSTSEYQEPLAVIEAPDTGYSVSFPVSVEQSKKVHVGDKGEVVNTYWGDKIEATLVQIKSDPEKPGTNKLLVFALKGEDIESGGQYTVSVGQKSATYDVIVPNSALRSDSNGDFVLTVTAKSSPLGNRYVATRVDVQVLAKDDINAAVSGGLMGYEYIITTSDKPLEPGMRVRLVEN